MTAPSFAQTLRARLLGRAGDRPVALKAVSFAMVGVVNTLVDAGVFFLAYAYLTSSLVAANVLAWIVAVSGSYAINSFTTFAAESGRKLNLRAYGAFILAGVAGLVANTAVLVVTAQTFGWPVWLAKVCAIGASFVVNFCLSHFVVFRKRDNSANT